MKNGFVVLALASLSTTTLATEYIEQISCPSMNLYTTPEPTLQNSEAYDLTGWRPDGSLGHGGVRTQAAYVNRMGDNSLNLICEQTYCPDNNCRSIVKNTKDYATCKIVPGPTHFSIFECSKSVVNPGDTDPVEPSTKGGFWSSFGF